MPKKQHRVVTATQRNVFEAAGNAHGLSDLQMARSVPTAL